MQALPVAGAGATQLRDVEPAGEQLLLQNSFLVAGDTRRTLVPTWTTALHRLQTTYFVVLEGMYLAVARQVVV